MLDTTVTWDTKLYGQLELKEHAWELEGMNENEIHEWIFEQISKNVFGKQIREVRIGRVAKAIKAFIRWRDGNAQHKAPK